MADHPCSYWHRRMLAKFAERGLTHPKCGQMWADHSSLGECPKQPALLPSDIPRACGWCRRLTGHEPTCPTQQPFPPELGGDR